ncbi:hypothetical protein ACFYVR_15165 [Rhodococcus sp. NPDC003318]|uniref:hypothetical protein n=1 Tax=Rhodococcus sp. NPDC003318 TaxID=3364503 RepID=UPI00368816EF
MIDRSSSLQGVFALGNSVLGSFAYGKASRGHASTIRVAATAQLPAAVWAEAPKRVVRRRAHAAALSSVPRIGNREHSR